MYAALRGKFADTPLSLPVSASAIGTLAKNPTNVTPVTFVQRERAHLSDPKYVDCEGYPCHTATLTQVLPVWWLKNWRKAQPPVLD
jgi:hypothetical protein